MAVGGCRMTAAMARAERTPTTALEVPAAALNYASRGWRVLPVQARGKRPLISDWVHRASCNAHTITGWWRRWADANIGILCGAASGIIVLDVDPRNGGVDSLAKLERPHGSLPATLTAETGRGDGGRHYVFLRCGHTRTGKVAPGLDLLADGAFFIAAPSIHPHGGEYRWLREGTPAPLPQWLVTATTKRAGAIPEGERNTALTRIAGSLRGRGKEAPEIAAALRRVNAERCTPPLSDVDVDRIATSVARYPAGSRRPLDRFHGTQRFLERMNKAIDCYPWYGKAGATQRVVLLACCEVASRTGKRVIAMAVREASELTGVTDQTAQRAIRALRCAGWLARVCPQCNRSDKWEVRNHQLRCTNVHRVKNPEPTAAALYRLQTPSANRAQTPHSPTVGGGPWPLNVLFAHDRSDALVDACAWRGLSPNARPLLVALRSGPWRSAAALGRVLSLHPSTTLRLLRRCEAVGLARRTVRGWEPGTGSVEDAVRQLASHGTTERRRRQHERDRAVYREFLTRHRRSRKPGDRALQAILSNPDARYLYQERLAICLSDEVAEPTARWLATLQTVAEFAPSALLIRAQLRKRS